MSSCDVFNCLFLLDVPSEIELLTRLFCLIHGLFIALLVEKCTACQSHWKSGRCKTQTADCGPGVKCRLQTESKTQAGCKMQNEDCRLGVKCRLKS